MRKHLALLRAAALMGFVLFAAVASPPPSAAAEPPTVTKGVLTAAFRTDDKPVSFIQNGEPTGFAVEFEKAIAAQIGLKATFVATNFASMLPAVKNHRYDTAAFGVLVTPAREKMVAFTKPIGYGQARLVTLKKAPIASEQGAGGKVIAITQGSALIPLLNRIAPSVQVKEFPNIASSLNALLAGQVDGLFTGLATSARLVKQDARLTESQTVTTGVAAYPVAKSNPELLAALNGAITKLIEDGTFTRLFVKWNPPSVHIPDEMYKDYPGMPHPKPAKD